MTAPNSNHPPITQRSPTSARRYVRRHPVTGRASSDLSVRAPR